jgi:hypothetical protein
VDAAEIELAPDKALTETSARFADWFLISPASRPSSAEAADQGTQ